MSTDQAAIDRLAAEALGRYRLDPESTVRLINVSENWTYRIDEPATGRAFALRVHRPGYHTASEIDSELRWIDALREDRAVETAHAVAGPDGERVCQVQTSELGERNVVLFEWLSGDMPEPEGRDLVSGFRTLGAVSAHTAVIREARMEVAGGRRLLDPARKAAQHQKREQSFGWRSHGFPMHRRRQGDS